MAIGILTADCAPIFFFDPRKMIIGAAHAGWRGAYKKIGPCISQNNYEVKDDLIQKFLNQSLTSKRHFKREGGKIYFDLKGYIFQQLKRNGIKNIEIIRKDTFYPKNNFFSARRSSKNKIDDYGRNISIIMIK